MAQVKIEKEAEVAALLCCCFSLSDFLFFSFFFLEIHIFRDRSVSLPLFISEGGGSFASVPLDTALCIHVCTYRALRASSYAKFPSGGGFLATSFQEHCMKRQSRGLSAELGALAPFSPCSLWQCLGGKLI